MYQLIKVVTTAFFWRVGIYSKYIWDFIFFILIMMRIKEF